LPGETWHPSVRKLQVISQRTSSSPCETIGYVYCDLFHRPGKSGNAAHYTVRCSRRVDDDDFEGDLEGLEPSQREGLSPDGLRNAALEVKGVKGGDREGEFQLPISVLNCDFEEPTVREGATLLSFQEVETIFHEMGHAMHCKPLSLSLSLSHPVALLLLAPEKKNPTFSFFFLPRPTL
jgi:intermediate peptidase